MKRLFSARTRWRRILTLDTDLFWTEVLTLSFITQNSTGWVQLNLIYMDHQQSNKTPSKFMLILLIPDTQCFSHVLSTFITTKANVSILTRNLLSRHRPPNCQIHKGYKKQKDLISPSFPYPHTSAKYYIALWFEIGEINCCKTFVSKLASLNSKI